jgi:hypothetical protein
MKQIISMLVVALLAGATTSAAVKPRVVAPVASVPTLTLTWQPVTTMSDGTPIAAGVVVTYNIYGGHVATGPFALATTVSTTAATRTNVALGLDCYYVTAVVNAVESAGSAVACITVTANGPPPVVSTTPATPLNLLVKQVT